MLLSSQNFFSQEAYEFVRKASHDNMQMHIFTGILDIASFYFLPVIAISLTAKVIIAAQKAGEASMRVHHRQHMTSAAASGDTATTLDPKLAEFLGQVQSVASTTSALNFGIEAVVYPCFAMFLAVPGIDVGLLTMSYLATKIAGYKIAETCRDVEINNRDAQRFNASRR